MDYFRLKKKMLMSITHKIKGFVRRASGTPSVKLEDCAGGDWLDLDISGNSLQNGTPTPDAPVEVQSVGEKTINLATAYDVCKNLADYKETTLDGRECVCYQSNWTDYYKDYPFKENTQYTVSFYVRSVRWESLTGANCIFRFVYTDGSVGVAWENDAVYAYNDEGWKKITLTSKAGKSVKGLGADGNHYALRHHIDVNTFQLEEGATVTPYEPYGKYKIPIKVRGKNMVKDVREVFKNFADYTELEEEDGRQCIRIKSNGGAYATFDFTFKENTQYTISFDYKCKYDRSGVSLPYDVPFAVCYTDGNIDNCSIQPINNTWNKRVLTTKAGKTISHIKAIGFDYRVYDYIDINTFQIAEGTDAEYEPYIEPVTTNIFLDEPLRKLGDYADYIDFKENKVVRKCIKKYLENYTWNTHTNYGDRYSFWAEDRSIVPDYINNLPKCNYGLSNVFPVYATSDMTAYTCAIIMYTWVSNVRVIIPAEYLSENSVSAFKSWLEEKDVYMIRIRKTPREEPLNIDLPKLPVQTTIVEIDTSLAPTNVEVEYYSNVKG